ncbi:MAG: beta-galactosidase [Chitinophagaceae bacterium]|nr:beta-galactosidase [Chitinophagaceae bacterium]
MKNLSIALLLALVSVQTIAQDKDYPAIVPGKITTPWAANVNPANPLPDYPRPHLMRAGNWVNLNGSWEYAVLPKQEQSVPATMQGKILVPFAVESALSGVGKTVGKDSVLWYKRVVSLSPVKNKKTILHFGAVDWECTVFVNGKQAGSHKGGYDPFSFDITAALKKGSRQEIVVRVWDPSDEGPQPRGKQVTKPHSIWYTPVTGIWQTVWAETVAATYITETRQTPDIDKAVVHVSANVEAMQPGDVLLITAWDGTTKIAEKTVADNKETTLPVANAKLWSPANPFLYTITYTVLRNGKTVDEAKSYFAMRKISMQPDANGIQRMLLNNAFLFHYGPLDQGWWPDGLYTAPTDEALKWDIVKTKEMGFNMIRKHVKVEPARWYYHCDVLGMLVWQDMPSGDLGNHWESRPGIYGRATDKQRTAESELIFRTEWNEIMHDFHNFPSIVLWVPFNEAWGQFKTKEIVEWTMQKDPSRLVNTASGGNFEDAGHITDLHNYPEPLMPHPDLFGKTTVLVLGEFGGLGLPVENHTWQEKNNWGYQSFKNNTELWNRYAEFINRIPALINKGLSAAVYTQTTDVEVETNGIITYDRKQIKMPVDQLFQLHQQLYKVHPVMK